MLARCDRCCYGVFGRWGAEQEPTDAPGTCQRHAAVFVEKPDFTSGQRHSARFARFPQIGSADWCGDFKLDWLGVLRRWWARSDFWWLKASASREHVHLGPVSVSMRRHGLGCPRGRVRVAGLLWLDWYTPPDGVTYPTVVIFGRLVYARRPRRATP